MIKSSSRSMRGEECMVLEAKRAGSRNAAAGKACNIVIVYTSVFMEVRETVAHATYSPSTGQT